MKKLLKFPLSIQFFSEEGNEGTDPVDNQVEKKTEEGTKKTFTQAEVDAIVEKRLARTKAKSTEETKTEEVKDETVVETVNPFIEKYAQAEIKVAMTQQGIDASKVNRAVRLIDHKTVLAEDGSIDTEKLNTSITELLEEWPELGPAHKDEKKGFKFGSDDNAKKGGDDDLIAAAFGNKI